MKPQLLRLLRALCKTLFRLQIEGMENYHRAGERVMIIANHSSLFDGGLLYLFLPEPPVFAINREIANRWYFKPLLKLGTIIEMDPTNPVSTKSFIKVLKDDRKALIFPEGRITVTGGLMKIYEGPGMIASHSNATLLPIGIEGLQYSMLSYLKGIVRRRWFPPVRMRIHPPQRLDLPAELSGRERNRAATRIITDLMRQVTMDNCNYDQTLFEAVIEAASRHGGSQKILCDINQQTTSYRQLLIKSFVLGELIAAETEPGETVGLMLPNAVGAVVSLLAIHAFGRIPAMLNFTAGSHGLLSACETAGITRVFTSQKFIDGAELHDVVDALAEHVQVRRLEDLRGAVTTGLKLRGLWRGLTAARSFRQLNPDVDSNATAVILFTSGSEGVPKGVVLSHRNVLANRAQIHTCVDLSPRDTVFNALPMFHCFGLTAGTITPLLDGAPIFLYPTPLHYKLIPELCYQLRATMLFGTNTFLAGYARHADPYDFSSMRYVVAGGEKLQESTRQAWLEKFGIRLYEGYGATEASPVIAVNTPLASQAGSVGQLVANMQHYLEPVEGIDQGGRLFVSGPNIMRGYLLASQPGSLVPPASERGEGWYDTGDIVSIDADGFIRILDRAKRFAKVGGEMISLTAVEDLARRTWPEHEHAALALTHPSRGEQILLVTTHQEADRKSLQETAKAQGLSELHLPRQLEAVTELPLTGTGKLDYRGLTDQYRDKDQNVG